MIQFDNMESLVKDVLKQTRDARLGNNGYKDKSIKWHSPNCNYEFMYKIEELTNTFHTYLGFWCVRDGKQDITIIKSGKMYKWKYKSEKYSINIEEDDIFW